MGRLEWVLIGDVIKSRKKFQPDEWKDFHKSIEQVNDAFGNFLKIPLTIYSGDSFGAVGKDMNSIVQVLLALQQYQCPQKSRYIIIEDEITYGLESKDFSKLEGPALWKSDEFIGKLKRSHFLFNVATSSSLLSVTMETILNFILTVRNDWNEITWAIYERNQGGSTQKEVAEALGISQQYVSKIRKQSKMELVNHAESNLKIIIDGITKNANDV